jgi:toxin YoeB
MKFQVVYSPEAIKDIESLVKSGNKALVKKFRQLILELEEHPETGTGKPERLKTIYPDYGRDVSIANIA